MSNTPTEGGVLLLKAILGITWGPPDCNMEVLLQRLEDDMEQLDGRERRILCWRYGLNGEPRMSGEQVGQKLGISKGRVSQIQARALRKLRHRPGYVVAALGTIDALGLPRRIHNSLVRGGILTIEDLLAKTKDELLYLRDFGKGSLSELLTQLKRRGLSLKGKTPTAPGWYWYQHKVADDWGILHMTKGYTPDQLLIVWKPGNDGYYELIDLPGQWGPKIEPPE